MNAATSSSLQASSPQTLSPEGSYPRLNTRNLRIEEAVLRLVPARAVVRFRIIPVALQQQELLLATDHPRPPDELSELQALLARPLRWTWCDPVELTQLITHFYGIGLEAYLRWMDPTSRSRTSELTSGESSGIGDYTHELIREALAVNATDIHLEPVQEKLSVRFRIDGILHDMPLPYGISAFRKAIVSSLKVLANLDIAERRLPQDGRIEKKLEGQTVDIRISVLPTRYGESVSLRLLPRGDSFLSLGELGLREKQRTKIQRLIQLPHGLLLFSGPTGSGKTTTQYAVLEEANDRQRKIITLEDPVEYQVPGITQLQMQSSIGFTFAAGLRSVLRHDPDVILVGEIRDDETANISIGASLTGHLVLSTLHTNDSASAAPRLIDMGIEPYLVASSLEGVVSQRLTRLLCPHCKQSDTLDPHFHSEIGDAGAEGSPVTVWNPVGCPHCRFTGYQGRAALFEILEMTDELRSLVAARSSAPHLRRLALEQGMISLRQASWQEVLAGRTTLSELLRITGASVPTDTLRRRD